MNDDYDGCWICRYLGTEPVGKLGRDHEHKGDGRPRGILCWGHNRLLGPAYTPEVTMALAAYLNRAVLKDASLPRQEAA